MSAICFKVSKETNNNNNFFVVFWKNWISKEDFQKYLDIKAKNQIKWKIITT